MRKSFVALLLLVGMHTLSAEAATKTKIEVEEEIQNLIREIQGDLNSAAAQTHFCRVALGLWDEAISAGVPIDGDTMNIFIDLSWKLSCHLPQVVPV